MGILIDCLSNRIIREKIISKKQDVISKVWEKEE
jgi:hypothetical protein